MNKQPFHSFYLLLSIEALATFLWLALIPRDPKNALLLGYSGLRLVLMGIPLITTVLGGVFLWRAPLHLQNWSQRVLQRPVGFVLALLAAGLAIFAGWNLYLGSSSPEGPTQSAIYLRVLPLLLLGIVAVLQAFLLIALPLAGTATRSLLSGSQEMWKKWRGMPRKEKAFTYIGFLIVILVAFVLVEIFLRIFSPQPTYSTLARVAGSIYTNSEFIPFTLRESYTDAAPSQEYPGEKVAYNINSLGLRGEEVSLEKPAGTQRILVLGDSYTFGVFVEDQETYSAILQQFYQEEGREIEVLNAGYASGWEPDEQYAWLVNRGLQFEPDLIIYGFYIGNDISGLFDKYWVERDDRGLPIKIKDNRYYVDEWGRIISLESNPYSLGFDQVYRLPILRESHAVVFLANSLESAMKKLRPRQFGDYGHFPFILLPESDALMQHQEDLFLSLVEGMAAVAEENDADFMVAMLPTNFQVEPDFLPLVYGARHRVERNYYAEIGPVFDALGINYIDILDLMTAIPGNYFPANAEVHFNPEGHRFTAEQIKSYLDERSIP